LDKWRKNEVRWCGEKWWCDWGYTMSLRMNIRVQKLG